MPAKGHFHVITASQGVTRKLLYAHGVKKL